MKTPLRCIFLLACLLNLRVTGQTVCTQYLNDFVPTASDSVLEVNLNFKIFTKPGGGGVWDANSQSRADNCIRILDSIYANIAAPLWTVAGVSHITHARIKFKRSGFSLTSDSMVYSKYQNYNPSNWIPYLDSSSLTLIFANGTGARVDDILPSWWGIFKAPVTFDIGSANNAADIAHEVAHMLGLAHTTSVSVYDPTKPPFDWRPGDGYTTIYPTTGCCAILTATDYALADTIIYRECNWFRARNNLVEESSGCKQYLSPQQMAVMHYHLRTDMKKVLTQYSYDNHLNTNPASDYSVTSSQTWSLTDRYFK